MQPIPKPLLLLTLTLLLTITVQYDQDKVNITGIDIFPQNYTYSIYSGYLNVTYLDKAFFYMLYKSQTGSDKDPVILWLNGGPGCSSMIGMVSENGPFIFKPQADNMTLNPSAWNLRAQVIYLESPAGVGFSVGKETSLIANDSSVAQDNYLAVQKFFQKFPEFQGNDFYIAGQSYAGIYIPRLARKIIQNNQQQSSSDHKINLKGILIGNGCTHPKQCYTNNFVSRFQVEFMYTRGFIDSTTYSQYLSTCIDSENQGSKECNDEQYKIYKNFIDSKANIYNVYGVCYPMPTGSLFFDQYMSKRIENQQSGLKNLRHSLKCSDVIGPNKLFNTNQYRPYLHVQSNETLKWTPCSDTIKYTIQSSATYFDLPSLVKYGLKIHYFSGDFDAMVPIQGTIYWLKQYRSDFGASVKKNWRPWSVDGGKTFSGMIWELDGITFWSVSGAGHMVPTDKPKQAKYILDSFLTQPANNIYEQYL